MQKKENEDLRAIVNFGSKLLPLMEKMGTDVIAANVRVVALEQAMIALNVTNFGLALQNDIAMEQFKNLTGAMVILTSDVEVKANITKAQVVELTNDLGLLRSDVAKMEIAVAKASEETAIAVSKASC